MLGACGTAGTETEPGESSETADIASTQEALSSGWSPAGSLAARIEHTSTVLNSGKVLVVGGRRGGAILSTAEVYDPTSGNWQPTGSLSQARAGHTATLLTVGPNSGKVLIVGGVGGFNDAQNSAEIYDPSTGTFTDATPMNEFRAWHTATLLPSGEVLVVSGQDRDAYINSVELYDPVYDSWTLSSDVLQSPRTGHTATLLSSGKVLIAGGSSFFDTTGSAEIYDPGDPALVPPRAPSWSVAPSMITARLRHTATLLPDGRVLLSGGWGASNTTLKSAELYEEPSLSNVGGWSATDDMDAARFDHTAVKLPTGHVLIAGGEDQGVGHPTVRHHSAELYDPSTGSFVQTAAMAAGRVGHTANLLPSGEVLVTCGYNVSSAELYTP